MARGTQHRKRRPAPNARTAAVAAHPRKAKPPQWQDQLFFSRLRNHAKWAYVGLAVAFVLGFVLLGVGSGSTGIGDALQNAFNFGSSSGTSISSLQKKVNKHPDNATDWRNLATALEQKQRTADAITALQRYIALRPKDQDALSELASEYTQQSQNDATAYTNAQEAAALAQPSASFAPASTSVFGKIEASPTGLQDPISQLLLTKAETAEQTAYTNYQTTQANAEATFQKLAKLAPTDVSAQLQLGQAAQAAGDNTTAIKAYERFLKLSPNDVDASQVKQLLTQAKAAAKAAAPAAATTSSK